MYCEWQALNEIPVGRRLEEVTPLQRRRETWGSGLGEPGERNLGERNLGERWGSAGGAGGVGQGSPI
jgi:hypothetical protein